MNKAALVEEVVRLTGRSRAEVLAAVEALVGGIKEGLARGEEVQIVGFGTFKVVQRNPRTGRNPKTGKVVSIPARRGVRFVAGKGLKEAVRASGPAGA